MSKRTNPPLTDKHVKLTLVCSEFKIRKTKEIFRKRKSRSSLSSLMERSMDSVISAHYQGRLHPGLSGIKAGIKGRPPKGGIGAARWKKLFLLDANIIVAILLEAEEHHDEAFLATQLAANHFSIILSPATFLICNHYIQQDFKRHKNKSLRDKLLSKLFEFNYGTEDDAIIRQVQKSSFHDKEDALQYFCARRGKAVAILTYNVYDFNPHKKDIQIYSPFEFIQRIEADEFSWIYV